MQDHNIPLSLSIISVYILTVLVLWNMFSKGHVTVMSCLFLQYDPSLEIFNMVFNTLWNIWHGFQHSFQHGSYHRWIFMFEMCWLHLEKAFWKFQNVLKSEMHVENYVSTCFEIFDMVFSMPWNFKYSFQHNGSKHRWISKLYFWYFHTFNAKSSLTFILCSY